ncbi:MAG: di-trans,poly-cis-decaprenylcistransferase [Candidatus Staskawiczbacteria bacterium RIFCSPLOWO2_01_FULL_33_9]|uniref:Isoprenyl transferase n=1 Tax=Candidatus Staskawiczbacteria bacterium RIFCSPLOWO2_01_FULL_33_9 TaxID=1802211 RepID=A0A1G2I5X6_9BACT|nr:MAG: di-trans,poly-cis-decaprenylcistransferase [Candidatus Staskawiczbacteria bacterium RIFCSPLOWO2_01_FULL_33_9]
MEHIPQHIVLFPDGNRRWAKQKGIASLEGHMQGYKNLLEFAQWCKNRGVKVLTAFGFSTENWSRTKEEVNYLMQLLEKGLFDNLEKYNKDGVKVRVIGQKERLPESLQKAIKITEKATAKNSNFNLNLAISYGGKWDILQAVKKIIEEKIPADKVDEKLFENYLSTAGLPNPDLIIRAGGEMRLSNFVLWQSAYSELYFSSKLWPDFTEQDLGLALKEFDNRARRFGK